MSQFRTDGLYLNYRLAKALRMVAKAQGHDEQGAIITTDKLVEIVLTEWLERNHKEVLDWLAHEETAQTEFEKALSEKLGPKIPLT